MAVLILTVLNKGKNGSGCAKVSGVSKDYQFYLSYSSDERNFKIDPTHKYSLCAYVKLLNTNDREIWAEMGIQTGKSTNAHSFNKEFLEYYIQQFISLGEEYNVPMYLGEFGVTNQIMDNDYNGIAWLNDTFDIINNFGLGYSYHDYHEENFGFYTNDGRQSRANKNDTLYRIFLDKVK